MLTKTTAWKPKASRESTNGRLNNIYSLNLVGVLLVVNKRVDIWKMMGSFSQNIFISNWTAEAQDKKSNNTVQPKDGWKGD